MCIDPMSIVGVLSAVVGFAGQMQDYQAKSEQWKQNYVSALKAGEEEHKALDLRMSQETEAFSQKEQQTVIEGAQISAEHANSAAAAGLGGVSLKNLLVGVSQQVALKRVADQTNYRNTVVQLTAEKKSVKTRTENRINGVSRPTAPNPLSLVVDVAGAALKGAE